MKKCLVLVLLLCLLCPVAMAEGKLEITDTRVIRYAEDGEIKMLMQLTNTGDAPIGMNYADVFFTDASGATVTTEMAFEMYPTVLQPGEKGYTYAWAFGLSEEKAKSIVDYSVVLYEQSNYLPGVACFEHESEYAVTEYEYYTDHSVTFYLTNPLTETVWEPYLVLIVRDQNGKILDIISDSTYRAGIPAGGSLYYYVTISDYDMEKWQEAGREVGSVETIVYAVEY